MWMWMWMYREGCGCLYPCICMYMYVSLCQECYWIQPERKMCNCYLSRVTLNILRWLYSCKFNFTLITPEERGPCLTRESRCFAFYIFSSSFLSLLLFSFSLSSLVYFASFSTTTIAFVAFVFEVCRFSPLATVRVYFVLHLQCVLCLCIFKWNECSEWLVRERK